MKQLSFFIILIVTYCQIAFAYPGGVSGMTLKGPSPGCGCHTGSTSTSVTLTITGPATLTAGQTGNYTVQMSGSSITGGGIDIAASTGTLATTDTKMKVLNGELTQKSAQSGSVPMSWVFTYTAPSTAGTQTLYATGCRSKNYWNHAANFSVTVTSPASVTVTAPNGGENWTSGSQKNITWTGSGITYYKIDYSTDNGTTWLNIVQNVSASPYVWTVPNTPSTNCKVKVSDANGTANDVSNAVFTISPAGQISKDIALSAGWNMVSIPLQANNMLVSQIFPAATSLAYAYYNGYSIVDTLKLDKGYWIRYANPATVTVYGSAAPVNSVSLSSGWNLIGIHHTDVPVSSITTTPSGIINSAFFGFETGYVQPTTLVSGKGYWVRATAAGVMNLGTLAKDGNSFTANVEKDWASIIVSDASGNRSTLYAGTNVQNITNYELPPVPPPSSGIGGFDVRYSSNRNVEMLGDAKEINISSAQYPVTIQTNGIELRVRDRATNGKLVNEVIPANGTLRITNPAVSVIEVQTTETPLSYELMQNYPNPFNPTTSIKFGLPEKADVSLTIYNQLGEKVATLVNGELGAGYHKVEWTASNMTSGIYFYEIKTDKFGAVKKLILMK